MPKLSGVSDGEDATLDRLLAIDFSLSCYVCARFQGEGRCAAYPEGIPAVLLSGEKTHVEPYPGDHSLRFLRQGAAPP